MKVERRLSGAIQDEPALVRPQELVADFSWERVARNDRSVRWTGAVLELDAQSPVAPR